MTRTTAPGHADGRRGQASPGRRWDPRVYQIATLSGLLLYGVGWLEFDVPVSHVVTILATVLLAQFAATRLSGRPGFDPRSALISGLSLCLLLRTNSLTLAVLTAPFAGRAHPVRGAGGRRRRGRPVQALPDERTAVVARLLLARGPVDRSAAPGSPVRLGRRGRHAHHHEGRTP